ncbi:AGAP001523-PA-like protein [Anopheles sinensis]|uniref:AGAP001523-PA-like protein n=1 Tax=Anopheles sinensis TaxID=74873 RepID=A0A084VXW6_ANOSI|nr:AGAP001523-PA-like protein [Anopheles sinensis]
MENIYLREQITKALHCLTKSGFRNSRTSSGKYLADTIKKIGAVKRGECFGLFGMNGAGKSTLLQMLSRNVPISDGEMFLLNCEEQNSNALEYRDQYGYCPQVDSLLDFLTVYQTIDYFASIKNMNEREKHIIYWLKELDILAYKDHTVGECSASTKRKLHMILALLGDPPVVLLDEPTTGVDPNTRRCIWKCIKSIQRKGQTILLASHKINECEELCNRLSYINNGALEFIGSMLELKNKYGESFNERFQPDNNLAIDRVASFTDH